MTLKADVQDVAKALKAVARKVEKIQRQVDKVDKPNAAKRKAVAKKSPVKKQADAAIDTALAVIRRSKKGVDTATLMAKTGFNRKKAANLFYKLKAQGKIKSAGKGIYVKS